jgi:small neutral amino acid transporter SnatA (MarC family)
MTEFLKSTILLLVVLNPFALAVYLLDLFRHNSFSQVLLILARAAAIGGIVFGVFAWSGEAVFSEVLQIRFAAFQVFGGILFLVLALRFMLTGSQTLVALRGPPSQVAGAIAMPFLIGPGTVSAATMAGMRLPVLIALLSVACALGAVVVVLAVFKACFDYVSTRNAGIVERYVDVASRVSAMMVGSIAVEMTFDGLEAWLSDIQS